MCLGIPSKIIELDSAFKTGRVDHLGTRVAADFALIDDPRIGDWVILHAGFAISRLDDEEAQKTLELLREIAAKDASFLS
ncbi:MAG: HypC/HybG/HupF family hydrogenase formation chaperone [Candidatus Aminicenantes bacterium]|jgi:hydrogenase expression/formation protein HypC|nr:HypC/HybG/HupF family hydrogenase formation chaperone [Candidatus Aminicenantes bacterium]